MSATRAVGRYGEDVAVRHLADAGWTVLARNWRHSEPEMRGELDIVAVDPAAARLRVDVLAVTVPAAGAAQVEHVRAVG